MTDWAHGELVEENLNRNGGRDEYDRWAHIPDEEGEPEWEKGLSVAD